MHSSCHVGHWRLRHIKDTPQCTRGGARVSGLKDTTADERTRAQISLTRVCECRINLLESRSIAQQGARVPPPKPQFGSSPAPP